MLLSCAIIGVFYLFTTYAAAAYVGPAHLQAFGQLGGGTPGSCSPRSYGATAWGVLFLAVVNSFFANGNSALIASTSTWYAMGRIRLSPSVFERTHPRFASPVIGVAVQTLLTLVVALPLALDYGPVVAYELLATILTAVMVSIYVINLSVVGYYLSLSPQRVQLGPCISWFRSWVPWSWYRS